MWHEFCARFEVESFSRTMEAIGKDSQENSVVHFTTEEST
jgi:hypothetical protein